MNKPTTVHKETVTSIIFSSIILFFFFFKGALRKQAQLSPPPPPKREGQGSSRWVAESDANVFCWPFTDDSEEIIILLYSMCCSRTAQMTASGFQQPFRHNVHHRRRWRDWYQGSAGARSRSLRRAGHSCVRQHQKVPPCCSKGWESLSKRVFEKCCHWAPSSRSAVFGAFRTQLGLTCTQ